MFLKKKWLTLVAVITIVFILGACSGSKESGQTTQEAIYDNPRNYTPEDFMPISQGLEEYSVWIETGDALDRNSFVKAVFVFEDHQVTRYTDFSKLSIEDIIDLTDDEIIEYVRENAQFTLNGKYNLNITLDSLGQYTEKVDILIEDGTDVWVCDLEEALLEWDLSHSSKEEYLEYLLEDGTRRVEDDKLITTTEVEDGKRIMAFGSSIVNQKIFDTNFSGLLQFQDDDSLITRVDDSFIGFRLDTPDTDKENVTIQGK